jgi:sugar transferase (PEP-CTERM/EpsH1 system associated)
MKILFASPYIPSLIRVRPYNLLRALAARGHDITLLALQPPSDADDSVDALREFCTAVHVIPHSRTQTLRNGLAALPGSMPLQAAYSRSGEFARAARAVTAAERFDAAHVEHLRGALLADALEGLPVVFDSVDSISLLFEKVLSSPPSLKSRLMAQLDLARTQRFEGRLTARFAQVAVTSMADRAALVALGCDPERVTVVPNGVDLDYFQPQDTPRDPLRLVFTGKMSYHANIAAVEDLAHIIMPLVWEHQPDASLQIVGKDPAPVIQALGQHPNITVTGFVPDMRPYLAQAAAAVSTVRYGVGIQNKVLEAMAMATPVVCSPQASSALTAQPGRDLLVGATPEAVAEHIVALLSAPAQGAALGAAGRRYVETNHTWDSAAARFERLYEQAARQRQQAT